MLYEVITSSANWRGFFLLEYLTSQGPIPLRLSAVSLIPLSTGNQRELKKRHTTAGAFYHESSQKGDSWHLAHFKPYFRNNFV